MTNMHLSCMLLFSLYPRKIDYNKILGTLMCSDLRSLYIPHGATIHVTKL
jgi:hypothetical protein